ncbi:MAG: ABC transporter substrate-binding protein [candidate division NC10 bacterium]|nr:ABC transporter substrate-binding protein [candidate division NC10 bacterium]
MKWGAWYRRGLAVVAGVLIFGVGHPAFAGEAVTIEYWHINSDSFGGQAVKELVKRFEAAHPTIKVNEKYQPAGYTGLIQQAQVAMAGKRPPAVVQMSYNLLAYAAESLPHYPIENFKQKDAAFFAKFPPNVLALGQYKGIQHGMPYALSTPVLFYNADLFKQSGLNPDRPPATWAEVVEASQTIKGKTGKFGIYLQNPNDDWMFQQLVFGNGGGMVTADGKRVAFDAPQAIEALQVWADLVNKHKANPNLTRDEGENNFIAGQIAMYATTIAKLDHLKKNVKFTLRTSPLPRFGSKPLKVAGGGNDLFILATDPAQQRAAWEFIKFLHLPESITTWVQGTGYMPPLLSAADDPKALKPFFQANPLMKASVDSVPVVTLWQSFPGTHGLEVTKLVINATQEILAGKRSAEAILKEVAAKANDLLAKP